MRKPLRTIVFLLTCTAVCALLVQCFFGVPTQVLPGLLPPPLLDAFVVKESHSGLGCFSAFLVQSGETTSAIEDDFLKQTLSAPAAKYDDWRPLEELQAEINPQTKMHPFEYGIQCGGGLTTAGEMELNAALNGPGAFATATEAGAVVIASPARGALFVFVGGD